MRLHLIGFVVAIAVGACGGGGDEPATDAASLYPLKVGNRWSYASAFGDQTRRVTGTAIVEGRSGFVVTGEPTSFVPSETIVQTDAEIVSYSPLPLPFGDPGPEFQSWRRLEVKLPIRPGDHWEAHFNQPGGPCAGLQVDRTSDVKAPEAVQTPAGVFQAYPVAHREVVSCPGVTFRQWDMTTTTWYAPGVGPVKREETGFVYFKPQTITESLTLKEAALL